MWVAKLDLSGNAIWAKSLGGILNDKGVKLSIDNNNVLALTNTESNWLNIENNIIDYDSNFRYLITKYDETGKLLYYKAIFDFSGEFSPTFDQTGQLFISGLKGHNKVILGSDTIKKDSTTDIMSFAFDDVGNLTQSLEYPIYTKSYSILVASRPNEIWLSGGFEENKFNASTKYFQNAGKRDIYLSKFIIENNNIIQSNNISSQIFPNPATDYIQITSSYPINSIIIHSACGNKILDNPGEKLLTLNLDISNLISGIYFVEIIGNNLKSYCKLIVK